MVGLHQTDLSLIYKCINKRIIMIFGAVVVLASANLALAQMITHPNPSCDYIYTIHSGKHIGIDSPGWPVVYRQGQTCRWIFRCPNGEICHLRCHYVAIPQSQGCEEDKILVSRLGSMQLVGADIYCGQTVIDTKSINQRITMGLITTTSTSGGRFRCIVSAEPAM